MSLSDRLSAICLALSEVSETVIRRGPTFRVDQKIFALDRLVRRRPSVWFKASVVAGKYQSDPAHKEVRLFIQRRCSSCRNYQDINLT
jgi:hypothetical protein